MAKQQRKAVVKKGLAITNARIITLETDTGSTPGVLFKGERPDAGSEVTVRLDNGVVYSGTVLEAIEADGDILLELKDGLTPVK